MKIFGVLSEVNGRICSFLKNDLKNIKTGNGQLQFLP